MMRLALEQRIATFRCPPEMELRLTQLADTTGYSRSAVIRKLIDGGLRALEQQETVTDIVIALNRLSRAR